MIELRLSLPSAQSYLEELLSEPQILYAFPMLTPMEIKDAVIFWMAQAMEYRSAYTIFYQNKERGMVVCYMNPLSSLRHHAYLGIVIEKEFRGMGIGTEVLAQVESIAKNELGLKILFLEVYAGNPAYQLYLRSGFSEYGRHPNFLKEGPSLYRDKILMEKRLDRGD